MSNFFLNLLFPIKCLGCERTGEYLCSDCLLSVPLNESSAQIKNINLIAAVDYHHPLIKKAIHNYKYNFIQELAKPLASLMVRRLAIEITTGENTVLVPVPLHPRRLRWRGFNQAELLAKEISQHSNIPVADCLIRKRYTSPQMKIQDAFKRKINIQNAFQLKYRPAEEIILIDDVSTSGATLEECAKLFNREVRALVVAKG